MGVLVGFALRGESGAGQVVGELHLGDGQLAAALEGVGRIPGRLGLGLLWLAGEGRGVVALFEFGRRSDVHRLRNKIISEEL